MEPGLLVAVVGETASGKTALAMKLAESFGGEIICADSRTVYKGMDIGTAKPTPVERAKVPHHLLDVVEPGQPFNVSDFKRLAVSAIKDIRARGRLPILVGGTGLYIDAVIFDYAFLPPHDPDEREALNSMNVEALQALLEERGIALPENKQNPRHLIRAIETNGAVPVRRGLRADTLVLGMLRSREELVRRITDRVGRMIENGLLEEAKALKQAYGSDTEALRTPGYLPIFEYLDGKVTLDQAKAAFVHNDIQLAKRQRTWFKRNKSIQWVESEAEGEKIVARFLENAK